MKKFLKIFIIIIGSIAILAAAMFFYIRSQPVPVIKIESVDLNNVRDGSYTGEFEASPVKAIVKVDVANHKITAIKIEKHENGLGQKAEKITDDIIKAQSLDVDVVSGATHSSKVILKAVEIALEKGTK